jgi:hypothetical protein
MNAPILYSICLLSLILYLIYLRYTNFFQYSKISMKLALNLHTFLIIFYLICFILLWVFSSLEIYYKTIGEFYKHQIEFLEKQSEMQSEMQTDGEHSNNLSNKIGTRERNDPTIFTSHETFKHNFNKTVASAETSINRNMIVNQLIDGPGSVTNPLIDKYVSNPIREYGVSILSEDINNESHRQIFKDVALDMPNGGLKPAMLAIQDKTSIENKGHFVATVEVFDEKT